MNTRSMVAAFVVALAAAGCGDRQDAGSSGSYWVGTITTEGNVTTVLNESGSVWGGTARLGEEASIGVETGEAAYMLGGISSMWATADRIYLLDQQPPVVRVYDLAGLHLFDIGAQGQGPGEFGRPMSLVVDAERTIAGARRRQPPHERVHARRRAARRLDAARRLQHFCGIGGRRRRHGVSAPEHRP